MTPNPKLLLLTKQACFFWPGERPRIGFHIWSVIQFLFYQRTRRIWSGRWRPRRGPWPVRRWRRRSPAAAAPRSPAPSSAPSGAASSSAPCSPAGTGTSGGSPPRSRRPPAYRSPPPPRWPAPPWWRPAGSGRRGGSPWWYSATSGGVVSAGDAWRRHS